MNIHRRKSAARRAGAAHEHLPWPEKFTFEQPTKAVAVASAGGGILLNFLPTRKIAGVLTKAALAFAPPVLPGTGVLFICEHCRLGPRASGEPNSTQP